MYSLTHNENEQDSKSSVTERNSNPISKDYGQNINSKYTESKENYEHYKTPNNDHIATNEILSQSTLKEKSTISRKLNLPRLPSANTNAPPKPVKILIPVDQTTLSQAQQTLPFTTNVNQAHPNTDNENPEYSYTAPKIALMPVQKDLTFINPILQPYPAITKQAVPIMIIYPNNNLERKTGMIDAAEQEIEECFQKINDIQYIFDSPVDGDDNIAYKMKQEDLKCV